MTTVAAAIAVALTAVAVVRGTGDDQRHHPTGRARPEPAPGAPAADTGAYQRWLAAKLDIAPDLALGGRFVTVPGSDPGSGHGRVLRYRVQIEQGLAVDERYVARAIHETLNDPHGWGGDGSLSFERVDGGPARFTVTLASSRTVDSWCARDGLDTSLQRVSCNVASTDRVMLNAWRWAQGSPTFGDDIAGYRRMLISHEVGHRLGHQHEDCPAAGARAPVMMQQTLSLTSGSRTCLPNPWPSP